LEKALLPEQFEWSHFWTLPRLDEAWQSLILVSKASGTKICLFIDGLDEYDGDGGGQSSDIDIASRFKELIRQRGIKFAFRVDPIPLREYIRQKAKSQDARFYRERHPIVNRTSADEEQQRRSGGADDRDRK